ncbi:EXOSC8 family protein [Megaselia abdita]
MAQQYKLIHPVKYYRDYLNSEIRPDGRETNKCRNVAVNIGSVTTADGSAVVKIGNTNVICGIRAELAKPKPSEPNQGFLIPVVELPQMCSVKYRNHSGANEDTDVFSCAIHDILVNSECLDLKELSIHNDKLVWAIYCDIICIDFDGSFLDAAILACVAALRTLKLPKVIYDVDINDIKVDNTILSPVNLKAMPICTTFMTFDDKSDWHE